MKTQLKDKNKTTATKEREVWDNNVLSSSAKVYVLAVHKPFMNVIRVARYWQYTIVFNCYSYTFYS